MSWTTMIDSKAGCSTTLSGKHYRPSVHFTPPAGFMNDPNGLVYDGTNYHLYYQHNPDAPHSANICWGHAISTDLLSWQDQPIAVPNTIDGQAFTGCAIIDSQNSSGLFSSCANNNLVAIYTRDLPGRQSQYLAVSHNNGRSFEEYEANPVIDIGSANFRDPQIIWHEPTRKWVMSLALVETHQVGFYGSTDLKHWTHLSNFGPAGLPTVNYECPNLIQIRDESGALRWVLFVSINPGAPAGGSITQYFIGTFDGCAFTPDDGITRLTDFAKDSYALQVWSNMPDGEAVNIAWMGNWQYCQELPTTDFRGVMSLPRTMSILQDPNGYPRLVQKPRGLEALRRPLLSEARTYLPADTKRDIALPTGKTVELVLKITANAAHATASGPAINRLVVSFANGDGETLSVGYDSASSQIWLDRSKLGGFDHPFFTGNFAAPINAALYPDSRSFDLHLVMDGCAFEVYANKYLEVGTALVYPVKPLDTLRFETVGLGFTIDSMELYTLDKTLCRETI